MQRLKTREQFQAVMAAPVVARTPHFVLHRLLLPPPEAARSRPGFEPANDATAIGAVTPKRLARRAVTRNSLKRQIYTVASAIEQSPAPAWYVVRLRSAFAREQFTSADSSALRVAARGELIDLWRRCPATLPAA